MKKAYEAPLAEELKVSQTDIMAGSELQSGVDNSGSDLDWDLLG